MSNNPFDRNKTKEAKLGHLITEPGEQNQRDAVHIAVVPVTASFRIRPGERVSVTHGAASDTPYASPSDVNAVGIADPFLTAPIEKGQTFWLFLFQGSVNTLRHEWTHDAFPSVSHAPGAPAITDERKRLAEFRMRQLAEDQCGWTLANLLEHAKDAVEGDGSIFMGDNEGVTAYPEFLEDIAVLTGIDIKAEAQ